MTNTLNNPVRQNCLIRRIIPKPKTSIEPGAIFVHAWGYEQTNIDFFMILAIKGQFAKIVRLESYTEPMDANMSCSNLPSFQQVGEPFRKKIKTYPLGTYINGVGSLWNGKPKKSTHYA